MAIRWFFSNYYIFIGQTMSYDEVGVIFSHLSLRIIAKSQILTRKNALSCIFHFLELNDI